jgi:hypothetical protein
MGYLILLIALLFAWTIGAFFLYVPILLIAAVSLALAAMCIVFLCVYLGKTYRTQTE